MDSSSLFLLFASSDTHKCSCLPIPPHSQAGKRAPKHQKELNSELRCSTQRLPQFPPIYFILFYLRWSSKGVRVLPVTMACLNTNPQNKTPLSPPLFNARDQCKSLHERQHDIEGDTTALRLFQGCRRISALPSPRAWSCQGVANLLCWPQLYFPHQDFFFFF